jgi:hypothetical protein
VGGVAAVRGVVALGRVEGVAAVEVAVARVSGMDAVTVLVLNTM